MLNECFGQSLSTDNTIVLHNVCNFISSKKQSIICITSRFSPASDCILFVLVKIAFVALLSGTVCGEGSNPIFNFGAVCYIVIPKFISFINPGTTDRFNFIFLYSILVPAFRFRLQILSWIGVCRVQHISRAPAGLFNNQLTTITPQHRDYPTPFEQWEGSKVPR